MIRPSRAFVPGEAAVSVWTDEDFEIVHQHFHEQAEPAFKSDPMQEYV